MKIGMGSEELALESGWLSLDFANTVSWHASENPIEKLHSYEELAQWAGSVGLIADDEAQRLQRLSQRKGKEARAVYEAAIELREAIYRILSAQAERKRPAPSDLEILNAELTGALSQLHVKYDRGRFCWQWSSSETSLRQILWPIARSAAELLNSPEIDRVGRCEDDRGCGWLFIDTSHNRSRRWCGTSCGNRAKVRSFRKRQKTQTKRM